MWYDATSPKVYIYIQFDSNHLRQCLAPNKQTKKKYVWFFFSFSLQRSPPVVIFFSSFLLDKNIQEHTADNHLTVRRDNGRTRTHPDHGTICALCTNIQHSVIVSEIQTSITHKFTNGLTTSRRKNRSEPLNLPSYFSDVSGKTSR